VKVEEISEVDPAVFTDVRNFYVSDISIKLPHDQLDEDELEEEK
jgi:hypothetical protein